MTDVEEVTAESVTDSATGSGQIHATAHPPTPGVEATPDDDNTDAGGASDGDPQQDTIITVPKIPADDTILVSRDPLHPAEVFAESILMSEDLMLNSADDEEGEEVMPVISTDDEKTVFSGINKTALLEKCTKSSKKYTEAVADFDTICECFFGEGNIWISRDILVDSLRCIAGVQGWTVSITDRYVRCNRYGTPRFRNPTNNPSTKYNKLRYGALKVNCTFSIQLQPLFSIKSRRNPSANENRLRHKYRPLWKRPVRIKNSTTTHGGGCRPGLMNRFHITTNKINSSIPKSPRP